MSCIWLLQKYHDCALLVTYKNRTENDKVLVENHKS